VIHMVNFKYRKTRWQHRPRTKGVSCVRDVNALSTVGESRRTRKSGT
jgi:hypothetical protein